MIRKCWDWGWEMFRKYREVLLYLIFGGLTTVINIVSYFVLTDLCRIDYMVSNALAWLFSVLFAYVTNRIWVFQSGAKGAGAILREAGSFFGFRVASGLMDMAIMFVCVSLLRWPDELVKILSNVLVIVVNYLFSKLIIFKKK